MANDFTEKFLAGENIITKMFVGAGNHKAGDIVDGSYGVKVTEANAKTQKFIVLEETVIEAGGGEVKGCIRGFVQKAGINNLTDALTNELSSHGIWTI